MVLLNCVCPDVDEVLSTPQPIAEVCVPCETGATIITPETIDELCPPCPPTEAQIEVEFYRTKGREIRHEPNNMAFMLTLSMNKVCYKIG